MMLHLILATLSTTGFDPSKLVLDYQSRSGLFVTYDGVQVVRGSFFQYYEGNWAKGIYSSNWNDQTIRKNSDGSLTIEFVSKDNRASGSLKFAPSPTGFAAEYSFSWNGKAPVNIENTLALAWAPLFDRTPILLDGKPGRTPSIRIAPGDDPAPRIFGPEARAVSLGSSFVDLTVTSSRQDTTALDGRGYQQDWAERDELFWIGQDRITVGANDRVVYTAQFEMNSHTGWQERRSNWAPKSRGVSQPPLKVQSAIQTPPKDQKLTGATGVTLVVDAKGPIEIKGVGKFAPSKNSPIRTLVKDIGLPEEGFSISISEGTGIVVTGQDARGLAYGREALGSFATNQSDRWILPAMSIRDYPSLKFRGVHLFIGPKSLAWHQKFATKVLRPLRFNYVVLQCEQTDWAAIPGTNTPITTKRADLKKIFEQYRSNGIEPIPLIQSFGHMEWMFANGKNREIAFNPKIPYSIDPRKPDARAKIAEIWEEAIALLKPKYLHFGLDEVDMRGFPDDPQLTTELWKIQIPFLASVAEKHGLPFMLWGDKGLAPGEAPDAALGDDKVNAEARRSVIPKGAYITDWHYVNNPRPEVYTSLRLWKDLGYKPIAATWNRPRNIYGFTHAAIQTGSEGVLQTTWAGYEASEAAMLQSFPQFSSMIQTGYYAWSGSKVLPKNLTFVADEVLQNWFFDEYPAAHKSLIALGEGADTQIGRWLIPTGDTTQLASVVDSPESNHPSQIDWKPEKPTTEVVFAMRTSAPAKVGETVATATVGFADGTSCAIPIQYSFDVRAITDSRPTWRVPSAKGWSAVSFSSTTGTTPKSIVSVSVKMKSKVAGLFIGGALAVGK